MQDKIIPSGKWQFNKEVTAVFGDMLSRSIPAYDVMRALTFALGKHFIKDYCKVIDLGCSTGLSIAPFVDAFKNVEYHLFDVSSPMLDKCRERFKDTANVYIYDADICKGLNVWGANLILSVLTVQFTPIEYRQKIINYVYESLQPEGAFIFVEKVLGDTAQIDDLMVEEYYGIKKANGYTQKQIESKRESLKGVLVPLTAEWNKQMLYNSGFRKVDCFFRCLNFAGYLAIK